MRIKLIYLSFFALLLPTVICSAASFNDGGFEITSTFVPWSSTDGEWGSFISGTSDATLTIVSNNTHSGSKSAKYSRAEPGSDNIHLDQILNVTPNTMYEITAWVKGDGILQPVIAVQTMDWSTINSASAPPSEQWTEVRLIFDSGNNTQLRFEWFGGADGSMYRGVPGTSYLDDVSINDTTDLFDNAMKNKYNFDRTEIEQVTPGPVGDPAPLRPITVQNGILVYDDASREEVALFGVNFGPTTYWEYRQTLQKYTNLPLTRETLHNVVDENLARAKRMGAEVIRIHLTVSDLAISTGDLNTNSAFLDAVDYQIAQASSLGIYVNLSMVNEMNTAYYSNSFLVGQERGKWITDPALVSKTQTYIRNMMNHVNPYTGNAIKNEPAIAYIEIMNEPLYVSYDEMINNPVYSSLNADFEARPSPSGFPEFDYVDYRYNYVKEYINDMVSTISNTGCTKPLAWNLGWPGWIYIGNFRNDPGWVNSLLYGNEAVFQAAADSNVDIIAFCLYPGQEDAGAEYWYNPENLDGNNYLPYIKEVYDNYGGHRWALGDRFESKAIVTYEFETFFQQTAYLYPAMARMMRALGSQIACMWRYTLQPSAEYFAGSHFLNLDCTPAKAASFAIASEVFKSTDRNDPYVASADDNLVFDGKLGVSFLNNLSVFCTEDKYMYSTDDNWLPAGLTVPNSPAIITGRGDSSFVQYSGTGIYFIDLQGDMIKLEITPDASWLSPHWYCTYSPPYNKTVLLDYDTVHTFTLNHPEWGSDVKVERYESNGWELIHTGAASFDAKAGKYRITPYTGELPCGGANLDNTGAVNFADYSILASQWHDIPGIPSADIAPEPDKDNLVDIHDLAVIASYWLNLNCVNPQ